MITTLDVPLPMYLDYPGEDQGSNLGAAVSTAGDVNKDGFSDVVVGAPLGHGSAFRIGTVYVFLGPRVQLDQPPDHTLEGPMQGSLFGTSVASAGDVNDDGFSDIIVGAPGYKPDDLLPDAGAAYVFYGPPSGPNPSPDYVLLGDSRDIQLGMAVAGAGDINNDGYDDVVIGAPQYSHGESKEGQIIVAFGSHTGLLTSTTEIQTIEGNHSEALFGTAVAGAGDVNNDGYADVIVGAPYYEQDGIDTGAAFLFLGSADGLVEPAIWVAYGNQPVAEANQELAYGAVVGTAGDTNKDGYDDWFVSARGYDGSLVDEGLVQVFYGHATSPGTAKSPWTHAGGATGARFGAGASAAGDVNNDGYADLIVGTPYYLSSLDGVGQDEPEAAFVYLGSPSGLSHLHAWKLTCNQSTTDFGSAVSSAGDTNGDGYDDLIIGAPRYKHLNTIYGEAFGYLGVMGDGSHYTVHLPLVLRQP